MRVAADAHAFLLTIEPVPVRPVVGQFTKISSHRRGVKGCGTAKQRRFVIYPVINKRDCQR